MALLQSAHHPLDVMARRPTGRPQVRARVGADVARRGQRKAADAWCVTFSWAAGQPAAGGCCAVPPLVLVARGAPACVTASPVRRAPRALDTAYRKFSRHLVGGYVLSRLMLDTWAPLDA